MAAGIDLVGLGDRPVVHPDDRITSGIAAGADRQRTAVGI